MNVTYKTNFIKKCLWLVLYSFILFTNEWSTWLSTVFLILVIFHGIETLSLCVKNTRKKRWNKRDIQHDNRTRANHHFAGFISFWVLAMTLLVGAIFLEKSILTITYDQLIVYTFLGSLILMWIIRDVKNSQV